MSSYKIENILSLVGCFMSGLASGSMYLYSAYAPQLASRLKLSATDASVIGMVGNLGMAVTGPFSGTVVDKNGPLIPMALAGILIFSGYSLVRLCYGSLTSSVPLLAFALLMVGSGSTFSFSAIVKCSAINFPANRGFATSVPLAAYGLSAFFLSSIGTVFVPGDSYGLLTVLCILPASIFIVCIFFVRFHPPSYIPVSGSEIELQRLSDNLGSHEKPIDLHGKELLRSSVFWCYFLIMGLLAGIGQMYIYSCGYCIRALLTSTSISSNKTAEELSSLIQQTQSFHVGILSISNFVGRIISGSLSDVFAVRFSLQRSWLLVLAACLSLGTQICGLVVADVSKLWIVSAATGIGYGMCYGAYPTIVSETFGMKYFSQNWGFLAISPVFTSYLFNIVFGYFYDLNSTISEDGQHTCTLGKQCYDNAFKVTLVGAIIVIIVALRLIYIRRNVQ